MRQTNGTGAAGTAARKPSLSARLLQHVMLPLSLTCVLGAAIAVYVGDTFTQQAFDGALLDDAFVVASHVTTDDEDKDLMLDLTRAELDAVLFDQSETVYFAVLRDDGSLFTGQPGLENAVAATDGARYAFSTISFEGQRLRAVRLRGRDMLGFSVVIAQTTVNRSKLLQRLLIFAITPQLLLLVFVAWSVRYAIRRDMEPLGALQHTLDQRDASDLTPLPPTMARDAASREIQHLGVAINGLFGRVGNAVRAQREFAGNVAHELRTPLAGIRALAEYGLAQADPQVQREQLHAIIDSQARASHLVDQLLALALADEARDSLVLAPVALDAIARETVLRFMPRADEAGVDLGAVGVEHTLTVLAQTALVEGALTNLLDNALRHGRGAHDRPAVVTVELTRDADEASLSVIDNGPGLTAQERQSLLQRWAQGTSGERLREGAGLGLAIVARYAELLQARFELNELPGAEGLRASLIFKIAPD